MTEQRLIDLEVKISHQELAIEALQTSVYEQQKEIDRLKERLSRHVERFESLTTGGLDIGPANEKPPHY